MAGDMQFELLATCPHSRARRGRLHTAHGTVETPAFMPVATQGTVKHLSSNEVCSLGFQMVLSNAYHLMLRPGSEFIKAFGGLHRFMDWSGPILTDSGGYQVMSLSASVQVDDQRVKFKSHLDGSEFEVTPERAIEVQAELGVDISMAFDQCPPYPCTREEAELAMLRTHAWARRCLDARRTGQAVFGIVQGGVHPDLRTLSVAEITSLPFDGYAIGGVSVGEPTEMQYPIVRHTAGLLPQGKARYLMGVGHPRDILHAVANGMDLFDCVLPTRMARHHALYTLKGRANILGSTWASVNTPPDMESVAPGMEGVSAAYLRHLFKAREPLGARLATMHNLHFYARLMREIREAIEHGTWEELQMRYERA